MNVKNPTQRFVKNNNGYNNDHHKNSNKVKIVCSKLWAQKVGNNYVEHVSITAEVKIFVSSSTIYFCYLNIRWSQSAFRIPSNQ